MRPCSFSLPALALLLAAGGAGRAQVIASAGFNDAAGLNSNPTPNSPYNVNNAPLNGQGGGEPGWIGPWQGGVGAPTLVSSPTFEGDGAAFFQGTAEAVRNLLLPPSGFVSIQLAVRVPSVPPPGSIGVTFRFRQSNIADPNVGIGPSGFLRADGHVMVQNGSSLQDTGMTWFPGTWYTVRMDADQATRTWSFFFNGVRYGAPLAFRGTPVFLDQMDFLNENGGPSGSYLDALTVSVPEPSSLALLGAAGPARLLAAWRPRGKPRPGRRSGCSWRGTGCSWRTAGPTG